MKKHKIEIAALSLLLVVLCYAFYDSNIRGSEQNIVLTNELFSVREIHNKEDITLEMLSLPEEEGNQEETKEEEITTSKENSGESIKVTTLAEVDTNEPYNENTSKEVVNYALNFVGNPYVYGGNSLTEGTDCSGFTKLIYATYGVSLPRSAYEQSFSGTHVGLENIMPGDLVFSGYDGVVGHVAIYMGNNQLVHALNSNVGIVITDLYIMPILDVRRVI